MSPFPVKTLRIFTAADKVLSQKIYADAGTILSNFLFACIVMLINFPYKRAPEKIFKDNATPMICKMRSVSPSSGKTLRDLPAEARVPLSISYGKFVHNVPDMSVAGSVVLHDISAAPRFTEPPNVSAT